MEYIKLKNGYIAKEHIISILTDGNQTIIMLTNGTPFEVNESADEVYALINGNTIEKQETKETKETKEKEKLNNEFLMGILMDAEKEI